MSTSRSDIKVSSASKSKLISSILGVVTFALCVASVYYFAQNLAGVEQTLEKFGIWAPLFAVLLYGILSVTPIPTDPLTVACGALWGPVWGSIVSWAGNTFAAVIEYFLGKGVSALTDFESKKKNLPWGLGNYPVDSVWFLIFGRMVPGFGSKVVSVLAGVYNVNLWRYTWTAGVANILGSVLYAVGGFGLLKIFLHI